MNPILEGIAGLFVLGVMIAATAVAVMIVVVIPVVVYHRIKHGEWK